MTSPFEGVRRALRPGAPRALLLLCAVVSSVGVLTACDGSSGAATVSDDPSAVVSSLGAVPIPSGVPAESTPSASPGHPAVLAMGGPVSVSLPDGTRALVTALGPAQQLSTPAPGSTAFPKATPAVVTLRLAVSSGSLTASADELSSRDETGATVTLTPVGARSVHAVAGRPVELAVQGTYTSGSAQVTWRHAGHVLGVWTFTIELD